MPRSVYSKVSWRRIFAAALGTREGRALASQVQFRDPRLHVRFAWIQSPLRSLLSHRRLWSSSARATITAVTLAITAVITIQLPNI